MIMMTSVFRRMCSQKEVKIVDLKEVHAAVKEALGEDYYANRELTVEEIKDLTGIKEEDIEVFIAEVPMISVNADTFIAIKAKEGKGAVIEDSLENTENSL